MLRIYFFLPSEFRNTLVLFAKLMLKMELECYHEYKNKNLKGTEILMHLCTFLLYVYDAH